MNIPLFHLNRSHKLLNLLLTLGLFSFHQAHKIILRQQEEKRPVIGFRLPKHVAPVNYKLRLWPNATSMTFRGAVEIELSVYNPTNNVTLHSNKLTIQSVSMENFFLEKISVSVETITDERQLLIVRSQEIIPDGRYVLKIHFSGTLDGLFGLFAGTLKYGGTMVASKFESTYAREAFPCFDEPAFKATFDVTLIKPQNYVALSNMNEIAKYVDNDTAFEAVQFATTVPMSTYLVCFVIGDFDFKETEIDANGIGGNFKLRAFALKDKIDQVDFVLRIGKKCAEFFINYFQVPFPLPKQDMIGLPLYPMLASEHWGLITANEVHFLIDDEATAHAELKYGIAEMVTHETVHAWFGNLVTMEWWNDVWLKEGFAFYMMQKCIYAIEPSMIALENFLLRTLHPSLESDTQLSSHPIVQTVDSPGQIEEAYDFISYRKGASILRMLEGFIGEENFRRGVSDYLKKHKFGTTITQDLLDSLEPYFKIDNPEQNLTYIMVTWTHQMGYPLVTVLKEANTYLLTQSRFVLNPRAVSHVNSEFGYRWVVPITYKTNKGVNRKVVWFDDTTESITITEKDIKWLKINNDQVGFYRVNYPLEMWQSLIEQLKLKSKQLTISDRAHLLNDVFALAEAGVAPYELALNLTTYLVVEDHYVPWTTAAGILNNLSDRLSDSTKEKLQIYVQSLVSNIYAKQNWEKSSLTAIDGMLRKTIIELACRAELPAAEEKVRSKFRSWLNSHGTTQVQTIERDLRNTVYFYGMKYATQSQWYELWHIYKNEDDVQEQANLLRALTAPQNTEILKKFLTLAWDERNIRRQDFLGLLQSISENPWGSAIAWDYLREHWTQIVAQCTFHDFLLWFAVGTITSHFHTEDRLKEMESFFQQHAEAGAVVGARARVLETVRNNIAWTATRAPQLAAWLNAAHLLV